MQTRYMERSRSMKRALDSNSAEVDGQPERKRPALASVIIEALKMDSLQRLCSSLEPILRRVVSEEVERALAKLEPAKKIVGRDCRSSPKRIEGPDGRNLQLRFSTRLSLPLFTGGKVEGEQGAAIHIVLVDANSGHVITSGLESSVKLDVVVLEGDFNNEDDDNWTSEDFESHLVKEREGKRPLLTGDLQVTLKEGIGTLGDLVFTDNSSWIRSRKFRLGLKVAAGYCEGIRIREARTEAFMVKDHRGELYKKLYPPSLTDEVWRLEKIGKDGSFHKRLNKAGIHTVEDFLLLVVRDQPKLRVTLGSGMSNKMWDTLIDHAKTSDSLTGSQKVFVDTLVKEACDNWMKAVEYDGKSLLSLKHNNNNSGGDASLNEASIGQQNLNSFSHRLSLLAPLGQPTMDSGLNIRESNDAMAARYSQQSQNSNLNGSLHFNGTSLAQNQLLLASDHPKLPTTNDVLSLIPSHSHTPGLSDVATPLFPSFRGADDFATEEEIRMRSHEMLEHEDMQHLLRVLSMGGPTHLAPNTAAENGYTFSTSYLPPSSVNYAFEGDRVRSSGKAVVGWLKLKAALRWGIFIRKKAAERRAQLVELDEA
ncbi:hypothetical protein Nepgr_032166 [Nepenthes gracilis]|uniref:Uncharacterized protein n=1 Tax=Nepenthes gracilis TaxID=150966 RepID=A0AAD3TJY1_NEPGR|nr:hypothetical protein Nepgr_032166 [Nepenthes gracilis]